MLVQAREPLMYIWSVNTPPRTLSQRRLELRDILLRRWSVLVDLFRATEGYWQQFRAHMRQHARDLRFADIYTGSLNYISFNNSVSHLALAKASLVKIIQSHNSQLIFTSGWNYHDNYRRCRLWWSVRLVVPVTRSDGSNALSLGNAHCGNPLHFGQRSPVIFLKSGRGCVIIFYCRAIILHNNAHLQQMPPPMQHFEIGHWNATEASETAQEQNDEEAASDETSLTELLNSICNF